MQAMLNLTMSWIDDIELELRKCISELHYSQSRLQDLAPPCLGHRRSHHDRKQALQGCPPDNITPQALMKWTCRPGLPGLHPDDLSFVHAVWHEQCFNLARPGELCDAMEEEFELLECRNDADASRLGTANKPDQAEEKTEDVQEDTNAPEAEGKTVQQHRVHVLDINEGVRSQYHLAACRWLKLTPEVSLQVCLNVCVWAVYCCRQT